MEDAYRSGYVNRTSLFRLPFLRQESPLRPAYEWTIFAENWWPHDGRKLTGRRTASVICYTTDAGPPRVTSLGLTGATPGRIVCASSDELNPG